MRLVYKSDDKRLNSVRVVLVGSREKNIITKIKKDEGLETKEKSDTNK